MRVKCLTMANNGSYGEREIAINTSTQRKSDVWKQKPNICKQEITGPLKENSIWGFAIVHAANSN